MASGFEHSRVNRLLPVLAGCVVIGSVLFVDVFIVEKDTPQFARIVFLVGGCAFVALGVVARDRFRAALARVSLVILSIAFPLAMCEVMFRVIGFDFDRFNQPGRDVPIYYRRPILHAGEGVFRRPGPASWHGKVLTAFMRTRGASELWYADERPIVVEYDALGFRNPADLTNWEVVVTGDSFVELGFLSYDELFTTIAAKQLGVRIKNLGVAHTGPVSQTFYVRKYGKSAATKDAVLCFFEGNDLEDLSRELRNRESFLKTGHPWEYQPQVSLLRALCARLEVRERATKAASASMTPNAALITAGQERPTTVYCRPPVWDRLGIRQQEVLRVALKAWADTVRSNGMRPHVMYLPDSHRVFHGFIRYTNNPVALWMPGDFGSHLGAMCTNLNVGFIDTFPALRGEAEAGRVPYNLIGDTHLSREGARVVANVLADALKKQ